jgi:putative FmdB family regulatory protein
MHQPEAGVRFLAELTVSLGENKVNNLATFPERQVPLYEYQCKSCHTLMERIQKFSDPPLTTCPHCGGELEQLLSAPAVQFKGAGWYVTDYARKGGESSKDGKGSAGSEGKSSGEGAASGEASKPEAPKSGNSGPKENK